MLGIDMRRFLDREPRMLLSFPGAPARWISCRIRHPARTMREARIYANEELAAMSRAQLQLLFNSAHDAPADVALAGVGLRNAFRELEGDPLEAFDPRWPQTPPTRRAF